MFRLGGKKRKKRKKGKLLSSNLWLSDCILDINPAQMGKTEQLLAAKWQQETAEGGPGVQLEQSLCASAGHAVLLHSTVPGSAGYDTQLPAMA